MNQQSTPHWLRLCTLGLSLFIGSTTLATPPQPTADDLYVQGSELFIKGRVLEARELLLRADLTQLERVKRQDLLRMVNDIDQQLSKMPESELRLKKAQLAIANQDYRTATSHLESIKKSQASTPEQKSQATDLLAEVKTAQAELAPRLTMVLQKAIAAFDAGNYGEAKAGLNFVYNAGVPLDLDQQKDLSSYIAQVVTLEAQRGQFVTPVVNVGVMQDQPPQEEPKTEEPEAQPEEPAAEEPQDDNKNTDLIYQAQQANAKINLAEAQKALASGSYSAAIELYKRVLAVQPDNAEAQKGLNDAQTMLNKSNMLNDVGQMQAVQHQQLLAEYNNLMEQARLKMAEGDYPSATDYVSEAKIRVEQGRSVLAPQEHEDLRNKAIDLAQNIEQARRAAELASIKKKTEEIDRNRRDDQMKLEAENQQRIAGRLQSIRKLQAAQRYEEALLECKTLLFEDPGNTAGMILRDVLEDLRGLRRWDELNRDQSTRVQLNALNLQESVLIPKGIVEYPPDWPELSLRRSEFAYNDSEADRKVYNALARQRANVDFHGTPLGDVLAWIGDVANVNMDVQWQALEQNFIDRNMPINLRLNDQVDLRVVLERTLAQLGTDASTRPQYAVQDGILTISTREQLAASPVMHVYDIGDLLVDVPHFDNAPTFDLDKQIERRQDKNNGLKASLFGGDDVEKYDRGRDQREQLLERIRDILTTTIEPSSWQVNGGEVGSIQALNSNLIITATAKNHRDISNLLSKLREIRSIQINVDSRFLIINEDYFEQVGIDLDIYFGGSEYERARNRDPNILPIDIFTDPVSGEVQNTSQRRYTSIFDLVPDGGRDANGRATFQQDIPASGVMNRQIGSWTPSTIQNNTLDIAKSIFGAPGDSVASDILTGNPAFTYGISFLNDIQVDLLIQATQADRRNIQLTSPKLTFFNGQRAFVQVTTNRFFISDLQPVVGDSSAGFDPTLQAATEGVVLDVEGTVSADRRYVTLTVLTSLSDIIDIQSTSIPIIVGGRVVNSGEQNDLITNTAEIQRPITQVSSVNTTVSVPDRGTIMLGGQSIRNDIQVETGIPVLSKIPIINRFFTNRIDSVEEKTLLILLKPTIIIQQENEQLLYPGLEDSLRNGFSNSY